MSQTLRKDFGILLIRVTGSGALSLGFKEIMATAESPYQGPDNE